MTELHDIINSSNHRSYLKSSKDLERIRSSSDSLQDIIGKEKNPINLTYGAPSSSNTGNNRKEKDYSSYVKFEDIHKSVGSLAHSQQSKSSQSSQTGNELAYALYTDTTTDRRNRDSYNTIVNKSTSSIISSFHALASKAKLLERQRAEVMEKKQELKKLIADKKRDLILWKNKNNFSVADNLLSNRQKSFSINDECDKLHEKIRNEENAHRNITNDVQSKEKLIQQLKEELSVQGKAKVSTLEIRRKALEIELQTVEQRTRDLNRRLEEALLIKNNKLINAVDSLETELNNVNSSNRNTSLKIDSLRKYAESIIDMNRDLTEILIKREESKATILRLANKLTPPRYAWPTGVNEPRNYNEIMNAVNSAATASALEKVKNKVNSNAVKKIARNINENISKESGRSRSRASSARMYGKEIQIRSGLSKEEEPNAIRQRYSSPSKLLERRAAKAIAEAVTVLKAHTSKGQRRHSTSK